MKFTEEQIKEFPAWLQKLVKMSPQAREAAGVTDEDVEHAAKAFHLDRDYTQKSQKAAALEKLQAEHPDLSLEDAVKVWDWWQKNGQQVTEFWPHRDRVKEILARPAAEPRTTSGREDGNGTRTRRSWREAEAADLYETSRLREVFEDLETTASERAVKAWDERYKKEEIPRLDGLAANYLSTAVDLIEFGRDPTYAGLPLNEVMKEAAAQGERDFRKVAKKMLESRGEVKKSGYDEGYQKALEDAKKKAEEAGAGPSGPIGAGQPAWRPQPGEQKPKTRDERAQAVIATVEKKHGTRLPL